MKFKATLSSPLKTDWNSPGWAALKRGQGGNLAQSPAGGDVKPALILGGEPSSPFQRTFYLSPEFQFGAYPTLAVGEEGQLTAVWQAKPTSSQPERLYLAVKKPPVTKHYSLPLRPAGELPPTSAI